LIYDLWLIVESFLNTLLRCHKSITEPY